MSVFCMNQFSFDLILLPCIVFLDLGLTLCDVSQP